MNGCNIDVIKKKMRQPPRSTFGHITSVLVDVRAPQAQTPRAEWTLQTQKHHARLRGELQNLEV